MYYGCKKEIDDKRDYKASVCYTYKSYPESHIIKMGPIKDQGIVNSCVAYSLSSFLENEYLDSNLHFSTGFIYGYRPLTYSQEEGMYPREALKTLQKLGDVENQYFDHNKELPEIKKLVDDNIEHLIPLAEIYKIKSYARIYTEDKIKECLLNDCPVPVSIPVINDLKTDKQGKLISSEGEIQGYHMIILYGYNKEGYLFQNSWGKDWGNKGCGILPYDYKIDSAWAISTEDNNISTYQTIWQKIYKFFIKLLNLFEE